MAGPEMGLEMEWEFGHETSPKVVYNPHAWKHINRSYSCEIGKLMFNMGR